MRLTDVYKVNRMLRNGASEADIVKYFRYSYTEEQVKAIFPVKPKKSATRKRTTKSK